ncbi:MAG: hypothetical protein HQ464_01730 [Planctomycetes bacterium]|nr:hypothetical protein [Planctomycetota bacterium]
MGGRRRFYRRSRRVHRPKRRLIHRFGSFARLYGAAALWIISGLAAVVAGAFVYRSQGTRWRRSTPWTAISKGAIFPVTANAVMLAWERVRAWAGIPDFRLHGLRHESISRFFKEDLSFPQVRVPFLY